MYTAVTETLHTITRIFSRFTVLLACLCHIMEYCNKCGGCLAEFGLTDSQLRKLVAHNV